jgi:DNA-binding MarR family transcriptional regulator
VGRTGGVEVTGGDSGRRAVTGGHTERCRELSHRLDGFGAAAEVLRNAAAAHIGLSKTDLRALAVIVRMEGLTAGQLAGYLGVSTGAITDVLDRLERSGHARRAQDRGDRRRVVVWATARGREHGSVVLRALEADIVALMRRYSDQELATLETFLDRTMRAMLRGAAEMRGRRPVGG